MEDVDPGEEASEDIERALDAYGEDVNIGQYSQGAKNALAEVAGLDLDEDKAENDVEEGEE